MIEPSGRSYIAIDRERLGAILRSHGVPTAKPARMEARQPQNGEGVDDDNTRGRKRRGHRDGPRPLVEGEVLRPPAQDSDPADSTKSGDESSSGEATPAPQLAKPYKPPHELSDEEIDKIAEAIVEHAYGKHKEEQEEFSNVDNNLELIRDVKKIMTEHVEWKRLKENRTAYWDKTVVVHNPNVADQGTTLQSEDAKGYYDTLK